MSVRRTYAARNYADLPKRDVIRMSSDAADVPITDSMEDTHEHGTSAQNEFKGESGRGLKERRCYTLPKRVTDALTSRYEEGSACKAKRWSAEKAHDFLLSGLIRHDWETQARLYPVKVKCSLSSNGSNKTLSDEGQAEE